VKGRICLLITVLILLGSVPAFAWNVDFQVDVIKDTLRLAPDVFIELNTGGASQIRNAVISAPTFTNKWKTPFSQFYQETVDALQENNLSKPQKLTKIVALSSYFLIATAPSCPLSFYQMWQRVERLVMPCLTDTTILQIRAVIFLKQGNGFARIKK